MVKDRAKAKFDETIEVAMNLGVDPRHADQNSGRTARVAVFARGGQAKAAFPGGVGRGRTGKPQRRRPQAPFRHGGLYYAAAAGKKTCRPSAPGDRARQPDPLCLRPRRPIGSVGLTRRSGCSTELA